MNHGLLYRKPGWLRLLNGSSLELSIWRITVQPEWKDAYCVPDLQFDGFIANSYHFGTKLHPNRDFMLLSEAVVYELEEKAWFPNP